MVSFSLKKTLKIEKRLVAGLLARALSWLVAVLGVPCALGPLAPLEANPLIRILDSDCFNEYPPGTVGYFCFFKGRI